MPFAVTGLSEIHRPDGSVLKKGVVVKKKDFEEPYWNMLIERGFVKQTATDVDLDPETDNPYGDFLKPVQTIVRKDEPAPEEPADPTPDETPVLEHGEPHGFWSIDPALLLDKSLKDLNIMIRDKKPDEPLRETIAEAIALLSSQYKAEPQPS